VSTGRGSTLFPFLLFLIGDLERGLGDPNVTDEKCNPINIRLGRLD